MAPAADNNSSQKALDETFLLTNMAPQDPGFNRGYWAHVENFVRSLTRHFDNVYVITGPLYLPEKDLSNEKYYVKYEVIGTPPNIAVPTHFFKVILAIKNDVYSVGAFVLPNKAIDHHSSLTDFLSPIEAVQKAAGTIFFPDLDINHKAQKLCSQVSCQIVHFKKSVKQIS
jgi:endonuclease G